MTTAQAILISSLILAGSVLGHAYITQPPRYQFSPPPLHTSLIRGDTRTGATIECARIDRADRPATYTCSP